MAQLLTADFRWDRVMLPTGSTFRVSNEDAHSEDGAFGVLYTSEAPQSPWALPIPDLLTSQKWSEQVRKHEYIRQFVDSLVFGDAMMLLVGDNLP